MLLVTLPETTPVLEATQLQDDLKRAGIEPWAWVINASLAAAGPTDPLLVQPAACHGGGGADSKRPGEVRSAYRHRAVAGRGTDRD